MKCSSIFLRIWTPRSCNDSSLFFSLCNELWLHYVEYDVLENPFFPKCWVIATFSLGHRITLKGLFPLHRLILVLCTISKISWRSVVFSARAKVFDFYSFKDEQVKGEQLSVDGCDWFAAAFRLLNSDCLTYKTFILYLIFICYSGVSVNTILVFGIRLKMEFSPLSNVCVWWRSDKAVIKV